MLDLSKIHEALLYWRGNMNASDFANAVGLTRQHVQQEVITHFVKARAADLERKCGRKHGRTLLVSPKFAPDSLWSFFGLLAAEREWRRKERPGQASLAGIDIFDLAPPEPADVVVWLCRAAAQGCMIIGHYQFKKHGIRAVRFSPHAMVRTPRRIHFRGHLVVQEPGSSDKRGHPASAFQEWGYRDLVPGRFLDDGNLQMEKSDYKGAEDDRDWHEETEIAFQVNPDLPAAAYFALQQEYGLESDREGHCFLKLLVRKALVYSYEHHVFDRTIGPERMKAWVRCPTVDC